MPSMRPAFQFSMLELLIHTAVLAGAFQIALAAPRKVPTLLLSLIVVYWLVSGVWRASRRTGKSADVQTLAANCASAILRVGLTVVGLAAVALGFALVVAIVFFAVPR